MPWSDRLPSCRALRLAVCALPLLATSVLAQGIDGLRRPVGSAIARRLEGRYLLPGPGAVITIKRVVGGLTAQWNDKTPTWLWPRPDGRSFLIAADTTNRLTFDQALPGARQIIVEGPGGMRLEGMREAPARDNGTLDDDAWPAARQGALFDSLAVMDSLLFDAFYTRCDADATIALYVAEPEFYHDQNGLKRGAEALVPFRETCPRDQGVRRELVRGSVRVYPMDGYGALQTGRHVFVHRDGSRLVAKFIQLWQRTDAGWRATRTISFDHRWRRGTAADE
jgi:hypothetical protein